MSFHPPHRRRSVMADVALLAAAAVVAFAFYVTEAPTSTSEAGEERRPYRRSRLSLALDAVLAVFDRRHRTTPGPPGGPGCEARLVCRYPACGCPLPDEEATRG